MPVNYQARNDVTSNLAGVKLLRPGDPDQGLFVIPMAGKVGAPATMDYATWSNIPSFFEAAGIETALVAKLALPVAPPIIELDNSGDHSRC